MSGDESLIKNKNKSKVVYHIIYGVKNNFKQTNRDLKTILTKKMLRVILNLENVTNTPLNNS